MESSIYTPLKHHTELLYGPQNTSTGYVSIENEISLLKRYVQYYSY